MEIRPLTDFFNPSQAVGMALQTQELGMRQQSLQQHQQDLSLTERLRGIQDARQAEQDKKMQMDSLQRDLLKADELGMDDTQWIQAQDKLFKLGGFGGVDMSKAQETITAGKELYRIVNDYRKENPDQELPVEIKGMLQGYLKNHGSFGARVARDTVRGEKEATMRRALKGDVDAMAELGVDNPKIAEHLVTKEFVSPRDKVEMQRLEADKLRIDADTARLQQQAGVLMMQGQVTQQKIAEYKDFVQPMHQLQLLGQEGKNNLQGVELELLKAKDQNFKAFYESLPQRIDETKGTLRSIEADESKYQDLYDSMRLNLISPAAAQAALKSVGMASKDDLEKKLTLIQAQKEDTQRELQWLQAPTDENFKAFQQGEITRRQSLFQRGEALQQQRVKVEEGRLNLERSRFNAKQVKDEAQAYLDKQFYAHLSNKVPANKAASMAAEETSSKYPGVGFDTGKLKDIEQTGKMTLQFGSPGERKEIAENRTLLSQIDTLEQTFKPEYVGAFDSKVGKVGQMTGLLSKEREEWIQRARAFDAEARHKLYGSSLTTGEKSAGLAALPNETMGDKQYMAALKAWKEKYGKMLDEQQRNLTPGGIHEKRVPDKGQVEQLKKLFPGVPDEVIHGFLEQRNQ